MGRVSNKENKNLYFEARMDVSRIENASADTLLRIAVECGFDRYL